MSHNCSTALVRCMDFRLGSEIRDYLDKKNLYNDVDIISVAGAAKQLTEEDNSFLEDQIDLSKRLHGIKTVILLNHTDCGGYGGRAAFASQEEEKEKHLQDLNNAKEKLIAKYPELEVKLALAHINDDGKVKVEEF